MKKIGLLIIIAVFVFMSCEDENPIADQLKVDIELIEAYLQDSSLVAESTGSGLYYIIEKEGNGTYPSLSSIVEVNYEGALLDGTVFDEGTVKSYPLYVYIKGWQEGIRLFSEGGRGTLFVPSKLGYGTTSSTSIPANSVLIFNIELVDVTD